MNSSPSLKTPTTPDPVIACRRTRISQPRSSRHQRSPLAFLLGWCFATLLLLAGLARGETTGYWELSGQPSIERPKGPQGTPSDAWEDQNGWEGKIYDGDLSHVSFGLRHPNAYPAWSHGTAKWDPLPNILLPDQVIPAHIVLSGTRGGGNLFSMSVVFPGGDYIIKNVNSPADVRNETVKMGAGSKGRVKQILFGPGFSALNGRWNVWYNYAWKDGTPPATTTTTTGSNAGSSATGGTSSVPGNPSSSGTSSTGGGTSVTPGGSSAPGSATKPAAGTSGPAPGQTSSGTATPPGGQVAPEPATVARMTLQAGKRAVQQGQRVTVPIWLLKAQSVANMNFNLRYDPGVATATGAFSKGNLMDGSLFQANPNESGIVRVGFAQNADLSGDGTVVQLTFQANGAPGTRTPLTLEVTTISGAGGGKPTVDLIHGEIVVVGKGGTTPGDSDGDGQITARDAGDALKMSVKLIPENKICDFDRDGQVTSTDARLILAKVSGK